MSIENAEQWENAQDADFGYDDRTASAELSLPGRKLILLDSVKLQEPDAQTSIFQGIDRETGDTVTIEVLELKGDLHVTKVWVEGEVIYPTVH